MSSLCRVRCALGCSPADVLDAGSGCFDHGHFKLECGHFLRDGMVGALAVTTSGKIDFQVEPG